MIEPQVEMINWSGARRFTYRLTDGAVEQFEAHPALADVLSQFMNEQTNPGKTLEKYSNGSWILRIHHNS